MPAIPSVLEKIVLAKREHIAASRRQTSITALKQIIADHPKTDIGFIDAISNTITENKPAVIAEIKKASPSKGVLREPFNPEQIAEQYQQADATCISVLTDSPFFQGHDRDLIAVRRCCQLPILRKDFTIDPYQIYEAKSMQANCILLIAAILETQQLIDFASLANELQLDVLLEVHNLDELEKAQRTRCRLIGINNRDLHTFNTDLDTTLALSKYIDDDRLIVSESGILTSADVQKLQRHNIRAFLVGEAFMRQPNPGQALQALFNR